MKFASGTPGVATLNLGLLALIPSGSIQMHAQTWTHSKAGVARRMASVITPGLEAEQAGASKLLGKAGNMHRLDQKN